MLSMRKKNAKRRQEIRVTNNNKKVLLKKHTYIHKWRKRKKNEKKFFFVFFFFFSVNAASQLRTDEFSGVSRKYILSGSRKTFWRTCSLFFHNFSFQSEFKNRFSYSHKGNFHKFSTVVTAVLLTIKRRSPTV